jgi:MFS family permease
MLAVPCSIAGNLLYVCSNHWAQLVAGRMLIGFTTGFISFNLVILLMYRLGAIYTVSRMYVVRITTTQQRTRSFAIWTAASAGCMASSPCMILFFYFLK